MTADHPTTELGGEAAASPPSGTPVLEARGIDKAFPGVQALAGVDLALYGGRVHALVGENGAGKSTLTAILGGAQQPDAGTVLLDGRPVTFSHPQEALAAGVVIVYQEVSLVADLTVADNVFLGREDRRRGVLRRTDMRTRTAELLAELGMDSLDPDRPVRRLSIAQQQIVEIARALAHDARVVILDEPSAVLAGEELERLFDVIRRLVERGVAVGYISHRLAEVGRIADDVTVLRDGAVVSTDPAKDLTRDEIVRRMVGRELGDAFPPRHEEDPGEPVLEVDGLLLPGTEPDGISLTVRSGEILGVAGLIGSGRSRIARALVGLERTGGGAIRIGGQVLRRPTPRAAARKGLVLLPEDRKGLGLLLDFPVRANVSLPVLPRVAPWGWLRHRRDRELAEQMIRDLDIRTSGPDQVGRTLSGGNQQKVVLAKWLATSPRVLVLDEPLRGVDVGAKAEIYALVRRLAADGAAVLLISSELPELLGLADRVLVMRDGRVAGELSGEAASEEAIMTLAVTGEAH